MASKYHIPTHFMSWDPRATMSPLGFMWATKGSTSQYSGNTGTTSMWELSMMEEREGSDPTHVITRTGLLGYTCEYLSREYENRKNISRSEGVAD